MEDSLEKKLCAHSSDVFVLVECQSLTLGVVCGVLTDGSPHIGQKLNLASIESESNLNAWHHCQCKKKTKSKRKEHDVVPVCCSKRERVPVRSSTGTVGNGEWGKEGREKEEKTIRSSVCCRERKERKQKNGKEKENGASGEESTGAEI